MKTAQRIGAVLQEEMARQGLSPDDVAIRARKQVDHVKAVVDGYPNSTKRPTQLDTVDEIASVLGLKLDLVPR